MKRWCECVLFLFVCGCACPLQVLCDVPMVSIVHRVGDCLTLHGDGVLAVTLLTHLAQATAKYHHEVTRVREELARPRKESDAGKPTPPRGMSVRESRPFVAPAVLAIDTGALKERAGVLEQWGDVVKPAPAPVLTTPLAASADVAASPLSTKETKAASSPAGRPHGTSPLKGKSAQGFLFGSPARRTSRLDLLVPGPVAEEAVTPSPHPHPPTNRPPLRRPGTLASRPVVRPAQLFVSDADDVTAPPPPKSTNKHACPKAVIDVQTGHVVKFEDVFGAILCQRGRLLAGCAGDPRVASFGLEGVIGSDFASFEVMLPAEVAGPTAPTPSKSWIRPAPAPPTSASPKRTPATRRNAYTPATVGVGAAQWTAAVVGPELKRLMDEESVYALAVADFKVVARTLQCNMLLKLYRY